MSFGSGSRSQDLDGTAVMILDMSASVYSWKQFIMAVAGGRNVTDVIILDKKFKKVLS